MTTISSSSFESANIRLLLDEFTGPGGLIEFSVVEGPKETPILDVRQESATTYVIRLVTEFDPISLGYALHIAIAHLESKGSPFTAILIFDESDYKTLGRLDFISDSGASYLTINHTPETL